MKTLSLYVAREIAYWTLLVLAALLILYSLLDFLAELDELGKGNYRLGRIALFVLLSLPGHVYELLPVAALIGSLAALAILANNSELTVIRTSGWSLARLSMPALAVGMVFVIVHFLFGEVVVPQSERLAQQLRLQALSAVVGQQFRSGLWVKDDKRFVNVQEMLPDASLKNVRIYEFDDAHRLKRIQLAKRGDFAGNNTWRISDVEETVFDDKQISTNKLKEAMWPTVLTPDVLGVLLVKPEQMAVWTLFTYIAHLRENRQKTTRYEIAQWSKVTYPLSILVMVLLAVPFTAYQRRAGSVGGRIFLGIMLGVAFHLLSRLASHLGVLNDWNPALAAIAPAALFLALALGMIHLAERR